MLHSSFWKRLAVAASCVLFITILLPFRAFAQFHPLNGFNLHCFPNTPGTCYSNLAQAAFRPSMTYYCPSSTPGTCYSNGWAGYVKHGKGGVTFNQVSGEWFVPKVDCSAGQTSAEGSWVGIGGWGTDVSQVGTMSGCNGGNPVYQAWFETTPDGPVAPPNVTLHPGDYVKASASFNGTVFPLTISDTSQNWSFSIKGNNYSTNTRNSAEWIVESPGLCNKQMCPLANFHNEQFVNCHFANNIRSGPITNGPFTKLVMTKYGLLPAILDPKKAEPGPIGNNGTSFVVDWKSNGS